LQKFNHLLFIFKEKVMRRRNVILLAGLAAASGLLTACGGGDDDAPAPLPDVVQLAQANPDLSILVEAVIAADLTATLKGAGPFTVFAPNNAAFAALLGELNLTKAQLLADKPLLTAVLTYHVLAGKVERAQIPLGKAISTVQGGVFKIDANGAVLTITDGRNRKPAILATDIQAGNGVVHVVDRVLLPADRNIVQTAQALPQFSILVEAVVAANLQGTLSGTGPFTVFAPTNDAFAALLAELGVSKAALLANTALLTRVLTYHVVPGRVLQAEIPVGSNIATVQGTTLRVNADLTITDQRSRSSKIIATDVLTSNGVVHAIDRVILPAA
jgi:uncharacterized surface protein with fasciclin (FAS1) repeats